MPCGICRASLPVQVFSGAVGFLEKIVPGLVAQVIKPWHADDELWIMPQLEATLHGGSITYLRLLRPMITLNVGASQLPGIPCIPSKGKSRAVLLNCSSRCFILHNRLNAMKRFCLCSL